MKSMVVLFAVCAVACGSLVPLAQPAHYPAVVLDPHGRPLNTAEVINARALHLQAKALEGHYAPLAQAAVVPYAQSVVAPALVAHSAYSSPLLGYSTLGYAGNGHYLKKRSLGHLTYAAPVVARLAPSAVSHQSRVDVVSSPAVVSHAVGVAPAVSYGYAAPVVAVAPSAVSHQSRVDVRTSPAVVSQAVAPLVNAAPVYAASSYAVPSYGAYGYAAYGAHGGLLRSAPAAYGHAW